jgi:hypothetical protein
MEGRCPDSHAHSISYFSFLGEGYRGGTPDSLVGKLLQKA